MNLFSYLDLVSSTEETAVFPGVSKLKLPTKLSLPLSGRPFPLSAPLCYKTGVDPGRMSYGDFQNELSVLGEKLLHKLQKLPKAEPLEIVFFFVIILFIGKYEVFHMHTSLWAHQIYFVLKVF